MGALWDKIEWLYSLIALIPILPFAIVLFGYGAYIQNRKKALLLAMDVSNAFFILCVAALFNMLFDSNFGLYGILLVMILGGGLIGNAQFRKRGNVDVKRVFRAIWRMSFFAMTALYLVFMIILIGRVVFTVA
ncbi:DUF3397 domain-containing protein [Paenibacillus soyae]|uniref:DUF3397 domain-containing protein n=1 Tax=Paenibacillus soyae TaxID=2969249 RepID=A0A9X2MN34_9BACL|nr:DUF3397 domain-containing protein [Paenibacillus soyae]MCR2803711.1 DUF3397 domain-containing protein [Paenibacillus soyae]